MLFQQLSRWEGSWSFIDSRPEKSRLTRGGSWALGFLDSWILDAWKDSRRLSVGRFCRLPKAAIVSSPRFRCRDQRIGGFLWWYVICRRVIFWCTSNTLIWRSEEMLLLEREKIEYAVGLEAGMSSTKIQPPGCIDFRLFSPRYLTVLSSTISYL